VRSCSTHRARTDVAGDVAGDDDDDGDVDASIVSQCQALRTDASARRR
jgi:hypothetical protein